MGKIVEFPENKSQEPEMDPDDLKLLLEQNQMLKYCLRIMNEIPLGDTWADGTPIKDEDIDYMQIWNTVALKKKVDPGEVNANAISFYFSLISLGYDNFGAMFFEKMANSTENKAYLYYAIKCFIEFMSDFSKEAQQNAEENKE